MRALNYWDGIGPHSQRGVVHVGLQAEPNKPFLVKLKAREALNAGAVLVLLLHRVRVICRLCQTAAETKGAATPAPVAFSQKAGLFLAVASCNFSISFSSFFLKHRQQNTSSEGKDNSQNWDKLWKDMQKINHCTQSKHSSINRACSILGWVTFSISPLFLEIDKPVTCRHDGGQWQRQEAPREYTAGRHPPAYRNVCWPIAKPLPTLAATSSKA